MAKVKQQLIPDVYQAVKDEYASAGLSDRAFGEMLSARLGATIPPSTIAEARDKYGIASWRDTNRGGAASQPSEVAILSYFAHRVGALKFINALEDTFGVIMDPDLKRTYLATIAAEKAGQQKF